MNGLNKIKRNKMKETSVSNNKSINSIGFVKEVFTTILYDYSTKWFTKLKNK